jgi:N-acetylglutamate synthase-like GNAT family acetyltransferase
LKSLRSTPPAAGAQAPPVRRATVEDVPALTALINRAYRVEEFFIDGDRIDEAGVRGQLESFLVLEEDDGSLGACVLVRLDGARGYLGLLSVDPARQGGGRGRRMIEAAIELCRAAGCSALDLRVVDLREELPPYYRKLGFVETGRQEFPEAERARLKRPAGFILMEKRL